ncbi:MAG: hypothetical protein HQL35_06175 [Alphaproteobacteria bacterium]|nr:hypothetical protein [Alphaproteobacteria bacterium]
MDALVRLIETATLDQRRETARLMGKAPRTAKGLLRMAERALARAEAAIAQARALLPPPRPVACGPNCPFCCHVRLAAAAPEILLVLAYVDSHWDDDSMTALMRKAANLDALTRGKNEAERERLRLPCPLLKDGSCAVHPVRPLSCRAVASVDVAACRRAHASRMAEGAPLYEPQYQIANGVGYGLYAGLADAGLGVENVEMNAALAVGLGKPGLARRWLNGETLFPLS